MKLLQILLFILSIISANIQSDDDVTLNNKVQNLEKAIAQIKEILYQETGNPKLLSPEKYQEYRKQLEINNQNAIALIYGLAKFFTTATIVLALSTVIYKKYCEKYGKKINKNAYEELKGLVVGTSCAAGLFLGASILDVIFS